MTQTIILPEMGEGVAEATVGRWLKAVGESVEELEPIVEVETDKVTTEVVAEVSGTLLEIKAAEGSTVAVGDVLALIGQEIPVEAAAGGTSPSATPVKETPSMPQPTLKVKEKTGAPYSRQTAVGRVSPVVARMAEFHSLDLSQIAGTGKGGRITKKDVERFLEEDAPAAPAPTAVTSPHPPISDRRECGSPSPTAGNAVAHLPAPSAPFSITPLTNMRRAIAAHMEQSVQASPHATTIFEVDFSSVAAHRKASKDTFAEKGVKLTFTAYIMQAVAIALQAHPLANSTWHADGIARYDAINIGMATALEEQGNEGGGLIVPVIQHAAAHRPPAQMR
ncbi:MAG: dihydrolipoamide acetyltransferase family protein [Chloroflexota bacterium]